MHRVFPSSHGYRASSREFQFHWVNRGDSGKVVTPFMPDRNYRSVGYATLGSLELRPPFTCPSLPCSHISVYLSGTGQASVPLPPFTSLQRPVFLLNSRPPLFYAPSLSLSFPFLLPNGIKKRKLESKSLLIPKIRRNFAEFLLDCSLYALMFSIRAPVSVYSTVTSNNSSFLPPILLHYSLLFLASFPWSVTYYPGLFPFRSFFSVNS